MAEQPNFQKLRIYKLSEELADQVWQIAKGWSWFAQDTVGKQLVRAADSVGANIAEGSGRGSVLDKRRLLHIARGSLAESQHWLRRAQSRGLLDEEQMRRLAPVIDELAPKMNAYLRSLSERLQEDVATRPARTD